MTRTAPPVAPLGIAIPTWNGLELLRRHLPSVTAEVRRWTVAHGTAVDIVISDDGSKDGSAEWLASEYPDVRVVRSAKNLGFAPAANAAVFALDSEIVVLLNNDLDLVEGALDPILPWFEDSGLFGVTFRGLDWPAGTFATGGKLGHFRRGYWNTWRNYDLRADEWGSFHPSFMLVGGFCALRKSAFVQLGGFDPQFAPYYWEDVDLSYRARKRGWRCGYEPRSVAVHAQSATVNRHRPAFERRVVVERNRFLFHWRNLDRGRLFRHLGWVHLMLLQMALKGNFAYHAGYWQALRRLPEVCRFRRSERAHWRLQDRDMEILAPREP